MIRLKEYQLDDRGCAYFLSKLEEGGTLSKNLADRVQKVPSTVHALLPEGLPEERVYNFNEGVFPFNPQDRKFQVSVGNISGAAVSVTNTDVFLANWILFLVRRSKGSFVVFEHREVEPNYPIVIDNRLPFFFSEKSKEVFSVISDCESNASIIATIRNASRLNGIAMICSASPKLKIPVANSVQKEVWLRQVVHSATMAFGLAAYDGESFLIWRPKI